MSMTGGDKIIGGRRWLYGIIGLTAVAAAACGWVGGSSGANPGDGEGPDFVVQNVDPSPLCPDAKVISDGFNVSAAGLADNALAARQARDPQLRLEQYGSWGRVIGSYAQWTYVTPSTLSEEEISKLSKAELRAYRDKIQKEALENPFLAATCSVELYKTGEGTRRAFPLLAEEARNPAADPQGFTPTVTERPQPEVGNEGVDLVYHYPTFNVFVLIFRQRNVLASLSVVASGSDTADYVEVLAESLARRLDQTLKPVE